MNLLIVDSQEIVRDGLANIMQTSYMIDRCFLSSNGCNVDQLIKNPGIDLIILDVCLADPCDGFSILSKIRSLDQHIKLIIFSMTDSLSYQKKACELGADSYLSKSISKADLLEKIDRVLCGEKVFEKALINDCSGLSNDLYLWDLPLSDKEREIFRLFVMGYPQKYISEKLSVSVNTIENYRQKLNKKLGKSKRYEWLEIAKNYHVI